MTLERWSGVPDLAGRDVAAIEQRTQELGHYLFDHLDEQRPNVLQRRWWDERLMDWAMRDEGLKVQLFRFVDVLPMLHTNEAVVGHLNEYLKRSAQPLARRRSSRLGHWQAIVLHSCCDRAAGPPECDGSRAALHCGHECGRSSRGGNARAARAAGFYAGYLGRGGERVTRRPSDSSMPT